MKKQVSTELVIEILERDRDWGRAEFIRQAQATGREILILSLGDSLPPLDSTADIWLDLTTHAKIANEAIQVHYPRFLHEAAKACGLLDITALDGKTSLYWFMPLSEMSLLRNPLIDKLYTLFILRSVLKAGNYRKITLILEDPLLEVSIRRIAEEQGVADVQRLHIDDSSHFQYDSQLILIWNWWRNLFLDLMYWLILHTAMKRMTPDPSDHVLGLTIFPTLWDKGRTNRAFGDFPEELKRHGHGLFYLALPSMKLRELVFSLKKWRTATIENRMVFVHSSVRLIDMVRAYLRSTWGSQLADSFRKMKQGSFEIDGINVTELLHRELIQEAWDVTIPQCILLSQATRTICFQADTLACAVHAFEFQPVEKAFTLGVKLARSNIPVIGMQTSMIGKSHLGFRFLPDQVNVECDIRPPLPPLAPLPDYIATYGTVAHDMLEGRLGRERVEITGPIRYPYLKVATDRERRSAEINLQKHSALERSDVPILLALTSLQSESETILKWTLDVGRRHPDLFFLVRFHYWTDLSEELKTLSAQMGFSRYRIVREDLREQLLACRLIITGTSSIGVEAIVSGCMPLVFRSDGRYAYSPMEDVAEGVYFFGNKAELESAIRESLQHDQKYQSRRKRWPGLLKRHCYKLDGKSSARLYAWLLRQGVFHSQRSPGDV